MKAILYSLLFGAMLLCLSGCASMKPAQKLELKMSKSSVIELMGPNYTTVAARVNPDGSAASVIKYELKKEGPLYLYFRQDELVQWGDISVLSAMPTPPNANLGP